MPRTQSSLLLIILVLSSCAPLQESADSISPSISATSARSIKTISPKSSATQFSTKVMPEPSATQLPTVTPSLIPTLSPDKLLSIRFPNETEVWDYLESVLPSTQPGSLRILVNLEYKDLSGDSVDDLIIIGNSFVVVQIWIVDHYEQPFTLTVYFGKYDPSSRAYFEDWTNDGIPEVIFEVRSDGGGTGVIGRSWHRYVISCNGEVCRQVWSGSTGTAIDEANFGGVSFTKIDLDFSIDDLGIPTITQVTQGFAFYCCSIEHDTPLQEKLSLRINPTRISTFSWNGEQFAIKSEEKVSDAKLIVDQSIHSTIRDDGIMAKILVDDLQMSSDYGNDTCRIIVNDALVRKDIGCKGPFSTLQWVDLTSNGEDELVYIGPSGAYSAVTNEQISEFSCVHKRLLAYQVRGDEIIEIANIEGCIVQDDLFGVRLEDVNHDGDYEILVARIDKEEPSICLFETEEETSDGSTFILKQNCWYDPPQNRVRTDVYDWDGSQFVIMDSYLP